MPAWPLAPPRRASQVAGRGARAYPHPGAQGRSPRGGLQRARPASSPPWSRGPDRSAADSQGRPRVQKFSSPAGSGGLSPGRSCPAARGRASLTPPAPTFTILAVGPSPGRSGAPSAWLGWAGSHGARREPRRGAHSGNRAQGAGAPVMAPARELSHPEEAVRFPGGQGSADPGG